ncbi:MAG: ABC transporter permease subunit [Alphaproteobacteria bacterium]|nr:ABC transporter permease subunit [Alphaproteobacteria bacterium]
MTTLTFNGTDRRKIFRLGDTGIFLALTTIVCIPIFLFLVFPLFGILVRSLSTDDGYGVGNFTSTMSTLRFWLLVRNSLGVSFTTMLITVPLAYAFAYALQRARIPFKPFLRLAVLTPLFAPSLVQAQGLILLLGRNGALNRFLGFELEIYGFYGIAIANALYNFPYAFLILSAALAIADARTYESAEVLGARPWRIFRTVTIPATRYGLVVTCFIVFTLSMTDFGNPIVIGGNFSVLATEIYNQVIGQAQFALGAVIGIVLLIPAVLGKSLERMVSKRQHALVTAQSRNLQIRPALGRDIAASVFAYAMVLTVLSIPLIVLLASFVRLWPYNMTLTLRHYQFDVQNGTAPLWNSVYISLATATLGVLVSTLAAIVVHKFRNSLTGFVSFLAILPAAVPGMVLGLGYVFFFNNPDNPLNFLYGSFALLVILSVYYNHSQAFLITSTSLKQIGATFDEASTMLGGSALTTLRRVTIPLIWPTLLGVWVFYFMRTMVSLSAIIFLITPATQVASVSVLQLSDRGAINQAAAFSVCIMGIVIGCLLLVRGVLWLFGAKSVALIR